MVYIFIGSSYIGITQIYNLLSFSPMQSRGYKKINININGSFNIMVVGLKQLNVKRDVLVLEPTNMRFVLNPVRVYSNIYTNETKLTIINLK